MASWPYPAPIDDGGARHLVPGLALPDIALRASGGGEISLARTPGRAVVFVYPWTGRPGLPDPPGWDDLPGAHGSTPEAAGFRNLYAEFRALGVRIYGLSTQDSEHQRELAARLGLPFDLLSDAAFELAAALRLPSFTAGGVAYLSRLTLVLRDGRIVRTYYPVPTPPAHAGVVLADLREDAKP